MDNGKKLSASLEDYLEAIYLCRNENGETRSKDIAQRLEISPASVTEACQLLRDKGLVNYSPYEAITLTESGVKHAQDVVFRHQSLRDFFVEVLKIDEKTADEGACLMEHVVSSQIVERMIKYTRYLRLEDDSNPADDTPTFSDFLKTNP